MIGDDVPRVFYRSPDGVEHPLSDPATRWRDGRGCRAVCVGATGLGAGPRSLVDVAVPGQAGTRQRATMRGARDIALVFRLDAPDRLLLRELVREWVGFLDTDEPGVLGIRTAAGTRVITAAYAGGLELDESQDSSTPTSVRPVVQFRAFDPYWRTDQLVEATFRVPSARRFFPILPLRLAPSEVQTRHIAVNVGDAETYPVWTVTGPGGPLAINNLRTGEALRWTGSIPVGRALRIDTDPDDGTVTLDGADAFVYLEDDAEFFSLPPGSSPLSIDLAHVTAASRIHLAYSARFKSA